MGERYAEVYKRMDGKWEWRRIAENGQIVATSGGQGFTERNDAFEAAERENEGLTVTYDHYEDLEPLD